MVSIPATNDDDLGDRVYAVLTDEDPKTRLHVISDAQRLELLERIAEEGGVMSDVLRNRVADLLEQEADYLERKNDYEARGAVMREILNTPSPAMNGIVNDAAERQRAETARFQTTANTMQTDTMAYVERAERKAANAEEATHRVQADAEADAIRWKLLNGPNSLN